MLKSDEAKALVEQHGSKAAAARAIGVPWNTFVYWLDPEPKKAEERRRYAANPEPQKARARRHQQNLTGFEWNRRLLQMRRCHALQRMREREERREIPREES